MLQIPSELALSSAMANSLTNYQTQLNQLETTLAQGQNISQPSDNPSGVVALGNATASLSAYQQFASNIKTGETVASLANSSLNQAVNLVQQIRSAMLQVGAPGVTASSAAGIASQISGLEQSLLGVANTSYMGNAIFAGTSGAAVAYSQPGGTGTAVSYNGNSTATQVAATPTLSIATSVTDPFGATSTSGGVFAAINQVISDISSGNYSAVTGTDLATITTALGNLTDQSATAGVHYSQLKGMSTQVAAAVTSITGQVASIQNLDYASLTTQYQQQLNNYQVALFAASKVAQPSLASYLP